MKNGKDKDLFERKKKMLVDEFIRKKTAGKTIRLGKDTSNLFRHRRGKTSTINVRDFNKVIKVDATGKIAEVEGMTTYETLVGETLRYGLMPTVVLN